MEFYSAHRLGQELKALHSQFDIRPREENAEIYHAVGSHPTLHQYEETLMPLLEAYENKIQEFEHGFETLNEEFIALEKKFEEVCLENDRTRLRLNERNKELLEAYRTGANEQIQSDFGQMVLTQLN